MKKIAICIPTYNRGPDLNNLLGKILIYGKKYIENDMLEICISDNASIDSTQQIVDAYTKDIKNFNYSRNKENLGFGINLRKAIEMASSDYCWLMGSDDQPTEQSFDLFFGVINQSPDIVIGNVISNGKLHKFINKPNGFAFDLGGEHRFSDYLVVCNEVSAAFAFISSLLVKKSFWFLQSPTQYESTHPYTHMIQLCKCIALNQSMLMYIEAPIIEHGFENKNEFNQSALPHFELDLSTFDYITKFFFKGADDVINGYAAITRKNFNAIRIIKARIEATPEQWERISIILLGYGYKESFLRKRMYDIMLKYIFILSKRLRSCRLYFLDKLFI